eukprot:1252762-Prymnesium_polylepis.1
MAAVAAGGDGGEHRAALVAIAAEADEGAQSSDGSKLATRAVASAQLVLLELDARVAFGAAEYATSAAMLRVSPPHPPAEPSALALAAALSHTPLADASGGPRERVHSLHPPPPPSPAHAARAPSRQAAYSEPPAWYYDVRDCLGYVLLHGSPPDAAAALVQHEASLRRFPRSGWALLGAAQAHAMLGDEHGAHGHAELGAAHTAQGHAYRAQFDAAWAAADQPLSSPCPQYEPSQFLLGGAARDGGSSAEGKTELSVVSGSLLLFFACLMAALGCGLRCRFKRKRPRMHELPMEAVGDVARTAPGSGAAERSGDKHLPQA